MGIGESCSRIASHNGLLRQIFVFSKRFLRQLFDGSNLKARYRGQSLLELLAVIGKQRPDKLVPLPFAPEFPD